MTGSGGCWLVNKYFIDLEKSPKRFQDNPDYVTEINNAIEKVSSIPGISSLLKKVFNLCVEANKIESNLGSHPGEQYIQLETALFELKAIYFLINKSEYFNYCYEPAGINPTGKRVDISFNDEHNSYLLEFKTTNPETKEYPIPKERFSANTFHANPMYYNWVSSARSHLLEFLCDTEAKLNNYNDKNLGVLCVYHNFYIEEHDLEFLWHYYVNKAPHQGDALGGMMKYEAEKKGMKFLGTIDELWGLKFYPQYSFTLESEYKLVRQ